MKTVIMVTAALALTGAAAWSAEPSAADEVKQCISLTQFQETYMEMRQEGATFAMMAQHYIEDPENRAEVDVLLAGFLEVLAEIAKRPIGTTKEEQMREIIKFSDEVFIGCISEMSES